MLGCKTCEELELIKFNCSLETSKKDKETCRKGRTPFKLQQRASGDPSHLDTKIGPPLKFGDCFEGLGTFDMKPFHINPNAEAVIHAPRTVPVHLQKCLEMVRLMVHATGLYH